MIRKSALMKVFFQNIPPLRCLPQRFFPNLRWYMCVASALGLPWGLIANEVRGVTQPGLKQGMEGSLKLITDGEKAELGRSGESVFELSNPGVAHKEVSIKQFNIKIREQNIENLYGRGLHQITQAIQEHRTSEELGRTFQALGSYSLTKCQSSCNSTELHYLLEKLAISTEKMFLKKWEPALGRTCIEECCFSKFMWGCAGANQE